MSGSDVVLFLHIAVVIGGLMTAAVMHTALVRMRVAGEVGELKMWARIVHRAEPLLGMGALVIFATGAWLVAISDGEFRFGEAWIVVSIAGLVVAEGTGGLLRSRSAKLQASIAGAADGPVPPELHRAARDRALLIGGHVVTALFFGVVFLMVMKPSAAASVAALVVAAALGAVSAMPFLSERTSVVA